MDGPHHGQMVSDTMSTTMRLAADMSAAPPPGKSIHEHNHISDQTCTHVSATQKKWWGKVSGGKQLVLKGASHAGDKRVGAIAVKAQMRMTLHERW